MASGRCERKKRNLGSLDLLSFSCLGTEIFGSHPLDLWVAVAGMRGGKSSNDSCWWSIRLKEFFLSLRPIRHLQSCINFTVWSVGHRCQNKGQIGAVVRWLLLVVCGREYG